MSDRSTSLLLWLSCVLSVLCGPTLGFSQPAIDDGPYLFHRDDGSVEAIWVEAGEPKSQRFPAGSPIELPQFSELLGSSLVLEPHVPQSGVVDVPSKLLALTDVEGQYESLVRFLSSNGVIDEKKRWAFGTGHLVAVGDFVDRGEKVTEVLWLLYRLEREARAAGGRFHYVLGNHEAMILGGDTRYIADKYRTVCSLFERPYEDLFSESSELGRWLRSKNCIVAVGETVFVHGGISPWKPVARDTIDAVNDQMRAGLGVPRALLRVATAETEQLIWGRHGPLWYRGYFATDGYGPRPLGSEITALLQGLKAKTIVVGHSKVSEPCFLYEPQQVLALDVSWTKPDDVRGLWIEGEARRLVDIEGKSQPLIREPVLIAPENEPEDPESQPRSWRAWDSGL